MDFSFTEEEIMFQKEIRGFAQRELAPTYLERAMSEEYYWNKLKSMAGIGLLGMRVDERYEANLFQMSWRE